nr:hypothetical protein [Saccharomonospora iraqiensis]
MRLRRAVDGETGRLYRRKDTAERADGRDTAAENELRSIGFLLLELGFTVAEEGGVDCAEVERTIARAYGLPGYADPASAAVAG